jgi:peptidoglycan DL-endopeptidase CwlO
MTAPSAVADVQSRIAAIQARFPAPAAPIRTAGGAATSGTTFANMLADATGGLGYVLDPSNPAAGTTDLRTSAPAAGPSGAQVINAAKRYLGVPYLWGGTDPSKGLDCSGFIQRVYKDLGIDLPRVSRDQARAGTPVSSLAQAKPGDLVAFGSPVDHIGIYAGDGKMIVAPRRGDVVKFQDVYREPTAIRRITGGPSATGATAPTAATSAAGGPSQFAALFRAAEQRNGLPPGLLNAVAKHESSYNPRAVSPAGARGLMQIMPATARELGVDPMVPAQAIDGAARYLASNLRRFGSVDLAVAAYNAGPGAVSRHGGIPPYAETRTYVQRVMSTLRGA